MGLVGDADEEMTNASEVLNAICNMRDTLGASKRKCYDCEVERQGDQGATSSSSR